MEAVQGAKNFPLAQFLVESGRLVRRCTKPDKREYMKTGAAIAIGFSIMGFIGFFVRIIHIPINNILLT